MYPRSLSQRKTKPRSGRIHNYDPLHSDISKWEKEVKAHFDRHEVADTDRPLRATWHIKPKFSDEFEIAVKKARDEFGFVQWAQFRDFIVAFDRKFREMLSSYEKRRLGPIGTALAIAAGVSLVPSTRDALVPACFTRMKIAAGKPAEIIRSIIYGDGETVGIYPLLQPPTSKRLSGWSFNEYKFKGSDPTLCETLTDEPESSL